MPRPTSSVALASPSSSKGLTGARKSKVTAALRTNVLSARLVSEIMKASFGPRGLDKMFTDELGAVHATSDGAEILSKSRSHHPIARMIAELGKSVHDEVGDGASSAVILLGALLENALRLVERGVHPASITRGYAMALVTALEQLREMAEPVPHDGKDWLVKLARTSIDAKLAGKGSQELPDLLVSAAIEATERRGGKYLLDLSKIVVRRMPGGSLADTRLIRGIVLEKDLINQEMPKRLENARIVVGDVSLVIKKPVAEAKIAMTDPRTVARLGEDRRLQLKKIGDRVIASGATVLINREGIDDLVAHQLARAGIMAVRHVKIADVTNVADATGATIVDAKRDITPGDLGFAALVEERKVEGAPRADRWIFIEGCRDPKALTILLRGGDWYVVDEAERSIRDALMVLRDLVEKPAVVAGGGAVESEISVRIRNWSVSLAGREQLAADAFADALEEIPQALAEKAGLHPMDAMTEIRSMHARGVKWFGVDSKDGRLKDTFVAGIIEPLAVKEEVMKAATETACAILRIDGVVDKEKPRAYRLRSEIPEDQRTRPTSKDAEKFKESAEKFPLNVPVDRRYQP